jgi:hypothetical protein
VGHNKKGISLCSEAGLEGCSPLRWPCNMFILVNFNLVETIPELSVIFEIKYRLFAILVKILCK